MRRRKRRILAAGMAVVITCSQYGSVPKAYANTGFYQIKEIEDLSDQVQYQKVPYGTRYQDLQMPDSIDVFVKLGGQKVDAAKPEETGEIEEATEGEDTAESIETEESEEESTEENSEEKEKLIRSASKEFITNAQSDKLTVTDIFDKVF